MSRPLLDDLRAAQARMEQLFDEAKSGDPEMPHYYGDELLVSTLAKLATTLPEDEAAAVRGMLEAFKWMPKWHA